MSSNDTYFERGWEYYKDSDSRVWPRRYREHPDMETGAEKSPLKSDSYVGLLLEGIDEKEEKTRPSGGDDTASAKDLAAFSALQAAGSLVEYIAGWAIDHQIGLSVENRRFVPLQPSGTVKHEQYIQERKEADDHRHEKEGGRVNATSSSVPDDPLFKRKLLTNLLRANSGGWPYWLCQELLGALDALDYGETRPLLTPIKGGNKRGLTALKCQLKALALVEWRRERGLRKEAALSEVGNALGVSPHTIVSWESRLRNELGRLEVDRTLSFARNHASLAAEAAQKQNADERAAGYKVHVSPYGEDALKALAQDWKDAIR